jgi:hypothetical protein
MVETPVADSDEVGGEDGGNVVIGGGEDGGNVAIGGGEGGGTVVIDGGEGGGDITAPAGNGGIGPLIQLGLLNRVVGFVASGRRESASAG